MKSDNEKRELALFREALTAQPEGLRPEASCPDSSRIWRAAQGNASPAEIEELTTHILDCTICAASWQIAVEFQARECEEASGHSVKAPSRWKIFRWSKLNGSRFNLWSQGLVPASIAATLVAVVLWGPFQAERISPQRSAEVQEGKASTLRGEAAGETLRGGEWSSNLRSLISGERLTRHDCRLRWEGPKDAVRYDLRVYLGDILQPPVLEVFGLETGEYVVPADDLRELPAGASVLWQVTSSATGEVSPTFDNAVD
ncbi:MAG: hypothetical protein AAF560_23665 [Acidobacteriota bacterium]